MKKSLFAISVAVIIGGTLYTGCQCESPGGLSTGINNSRRIAVDEYVDKMMGGWLGQMAGVGWAASTEFKYCGVTMPEDAMPRWQREAVNQFEQDDLYVEMIFLRTLEIYGLEVSSRQAGIDFANSQCALWHANLAARNNLRNGIAPPDSGHPQFNNHADDIDYQIEADFSGLIAPGLPNIPVRLGEKFGRLINYGDGLYAGQFVGGMYAEAFFEEDLEKIVRAGLKCIPKDSQYYECISDVLKWYKKYPDSWGKTWQLVKEKYQVNPNYRRFSCDKGDLNIDAKINGAYAVIGLLYGKGYPDATIAIAARCGQDSDCNPSTAAGILFTTFGYRTVPNEFKSALDQESKFSCSPYNFPTLIEVCQKLARQAVLSSGGRIDTDDQGRECFVIPKQQPRPSALERSWAPGPISNSRFPGQEITQVTGTAGKDLSEAISKFAPGWHINRCGNGMEDMKPGLWAQLRGKKNILVTDPLDENTGCVISGKVELPADKKTMLRLVVGHDARGDWDLIVRADGTELLRKTVGPDTAHFGWLDVEVDLSQYAGRTIDLELINQPTGWHYEMALWSEIAFVTQ